MQRPSFPRLVVMLNVLLGTLFLLADHLSSVADFEFEHDVHLMDPLVLAWGMASLFFVVAGFMIRSDRLLLGFFVMPLILSVRSMSGPMVLPNPERAALAKMSASINSLRLAIAQYQDDHGGKGPPVDRWISSLAEGGYLLGGKLPINPYAKHAEPQNVAPAPGPRLSRAADAAERGLTPAVYTPLGQGHSPRHGVYDAHTYGAILYDYDPQTAAYLLIGLGRYQGQLVVAGSAASAASEEAPLPPGAPRPTPHDE